MRRFQITCNHLFRSVSARMDLHNDSTSFSLPKTKGAVTAGILIIGDEILKGHTQDTNSFFITKKLFSMGVNVKKISVVPDDLNTIAAEVSEFSKNYTHVITAGGIGPTHDDITFEAVARAFNVATEFHPYIVKMISEAFKTADMASPEMKMAKIPKNAKLNFGVDPRTNQTSRYPLISVNNVFIFPGIPSLLEKAFSMDEIQNPNVEFHTEKLYVNVDEISIARSITTVAEKFKGTVTIGSYPDLMNSYYKVKLTLESDKQEDVLMAKRELVALMPEGSVISYDSDPVKSASESVYGLIENADPNDVFVHVLKEALSTLEEALEKYQLHEICIGFNGGKDCTVLLHLFYAVVKRKCPDFKDKLQALYIRSRCPFPEEEKFVQISRDRYNIETIHYEGRIKDSMQTMAEKQPQIKAVIMGTRKTDPYCDHLTLFAMTDEDWPQFMRINPLLNWHYSHVWKFLRHLCLPYCSLYDRGYTSLGSMDNTHPNPCLQYVDNRGILTYKPAYELQDGSKERDGRNK